MSATIFHTPTLSHTILHTQLCHTPSFTHNFVIHLLSHTIFHTPSFTHNFVTHHLSHTNFVTHHLSHTIFVTHHLSHTTLSHTIFHHTILHTPLCHTPSFTTPSFTHHFLTHHLSHTTLSPTTWHLTSTSHPPSTCVAGVAPGDIHLCFAWPAWHLETSTFVLRGRRATYSTGLALVARLGWELVAGDAATLCVAGVALGNIHLRFTWQAWHLETSTFVLRGRRGNGLALVARLGWDWSPVTPRHFAWQA